MKREISIKIDWSLCVGLSASVKRDSAGISVAGAQWNLTIRCGKFSFAFISSAVLCRSVERSNLKRHGLWPKFQFHFERIWRISKIQRLERVWSASIVTIAIMKWVGQGNIKRKSPAGRGTPAGSDPFGNSRWRRSKMAVEPNWFFLPF